MKGDISVRALFIILIFLVAIVAGSFVLKNVLIDEKLKSYRTSTHSIALEVSNLISIANSTIGDITLDYELDPKNPITIKTDGNLVRVDRILEDKTKQSFTFSAPIYLGKMEASGYKFRISKIDGAIRIVSAV